MPQVSIKIPYEIAIMAEGGAKLARVKNAISKTVAVGVSAWDIEELATKLILDEGATPSFKMVPGYSWTTCVNVNEGIVHGIPRSDMLFKGGDLVSVDLGLFYKGFHTDTSISIYLGDDPETVKFMDVGRRALNDAIKTAKVGKTIGDIAGVIENAITQGGYKPVRSLVGHGVGRSLHEYPPVPCFVSGGASERIILDPGMVLAIEVMYTMGDPDLVTDSDGWTIKTRDGKISALFEETVAIKASGPLVLTKA